MKNLDCHPVLCSATESAREDGEPPGRMGAEAPCTFEELEEQLSQNVAPQADQNKAVINLHRYTFRKKFFPKATVADWNDWHWQLQNRVQDLATLEKMFRLSDDERQALSNPSGALPVAITPYYASLIDPYDPKQPLRRTMLPAMKEYVHSPGEEEDPLGEDHQSPAEGLIHRYPDRALFLVTNYCSAYCRYCTRSRIMNRDCASHYNMNQWQKALEYIEAHPAIRDVLMSGGDPLTMDEERLEWLLSRLRKIPHVEMIRIGTKVPAVLPQRITPKLTKMLRKYHPLWISIHFAHPDELTSETAQACTRLADAGIPLGSQTVLLSGINDNVETMKKLVQGLLRIRVRPYYLYQCDPILGSSHFRTPVEKGLEIIKGLRGHTTGYAVPNYVIDAPKGGGKIPLLPDYVQGYDGTDLLLKNYENKFFRYPDCIKEQK